MRYRYCPLCGEKLTLRPAGDDGLVPYCTHCRRYWFDAFASCSIVLLANQERQIMMLDQAYLSRDHQTFVAGFIQPGETAEECAVREVKEEVAQEVDKLINCGTCWFEAREQLMHGFIALTQARPLAVSSELDGARWVPYRQAPDHMFPDRPGNMQWALYRRYLQLLGEQ
jgi:NAD+ diphosphatase